MAGRPTVAISVVANAARARQELSKTGAAAKGMGKSFGGASSALKAVAFGAAAAGVVALGKSVASAASDAQQSLGATETVFGKFAKTVETTSAKAASAYGLSANEYRENANLIGSLFKNQGVAADKLASSTEAVVKKGADLSATFGGSASDAVASLSSAFKGEFDSLEKYGISLKQSTVNTEAMRLANVGSKKEWDKLTLAQQKTATQQATMGLINKQSADSAGAFSKETGTLAHQQQVLSAKVENVKAKVGNALLPILTKMTAFVSDKVIPKLELFGKWLGEKLPPFVDQIKAKLAEFRDALQPVIDKVQAVFDKLGGWQGIFDKVKTVLASPEFKAFAITLGAVAVAVGVVSTAVAIFNAVLALNPISLIVIAIALFVASLVALYRRSETAKKVIDTAFKGIKIAIDIVVQFVKNVLWPAIKLYIGFVIGYYKLIWTVAKTAFSAVAGAIGWIVGAVKGAASGVAGFVTTVKEKFGAIKTAVSDKIGDAIGVIKGLPQRAKDALANIGTALKDAGVAIIQGLLDGINSMITKVTDRLGWLTDKLPDWKGPKKKDKVILKPVGQMIIKGLIDGFAAAAPNVKKFLATLTSQLAKVDVTKKQRTKITQAIARAKKDSKKLADAYALVGKKLVAAQGKIDALRAKKADFANTAKEGIYSGLFSVPKEEGQSFVQALRARVAAAAKFAADLAGLKARGASASLLEQIAAQGVETGGAAAAELLGAGATAIQQASKLDAQLAATAAKFGKDQSAAYYDSGIKAAQGTIDGLKAKQKQLQAQFSEIAVKFAADVARALGASAKGGKNGVITIKGTAHTSADAKELIKALQEWTRVNGPIRGVKFS